MIIGIDPGVTTGWAVADGGRLIGASSMTAVEAMLTVQSMRQSIKRVIFEDARLRGGKRARAGLDAAEIGRLQGAGSIKRECAIWADWLAAMDVPYLAVSPKAKGAKLDAERFARLTGWPGRTNNHARDAAMLIWGRS